MRNALSLSDTVCDRYFRPGSGFDSDLGQTYAGRRRFLMGTVDIDRNGMRGEQCATGLREEMKTVRCLVCLVPLAALSPPTPPRLSVTSSRASRGQTRRGGHIVLFTVVSRCDFLGTLSKQARAHNTAPASPQIIARNIPRTLGSRRWCRRVAPPEGLERLECVHGLAMYLTIVPISKGPCTLARFGSKIPLMVVSPPSSCAYLERPESVRRDLDGAVVRACPE